MSETTNRNQDLENYLTRLEKCLQSTSVSERAEIITEIRSHVLDATDRDPEQSIRNVLASLGEPEVVANRYLIERGLKPSKPPKGPIVKWLTIGFVTTFGIAVLGTIIICFMFTPLIKVDEKANRVVILGGLIDIDGDGQNIKIGDSKLHVDDTKGVFNGSRPVKGEKKFKFDIKVGSVSVAPVLDGVLKFECEHQGKVRHKSIKENDQDVTLEVDASGGANCKIGLPETMGLEINVGTGTADIGAVKKTSSVSVKTGEIIFRPDSKTKYNVNAQVKVGSVDSFDSVATGVPMELLVKTGSIQRK